MNWKAPKTAPDKDEKRVTKKFAWRVRTIGNTCVWLESYYVTEEAVGSSLFGFSYAAGVVAVRPMYFWGNQKEWTRKDYKASAGGCGLGQQLFKADAARREQA